MNKFKLHPRMHTHITFSITCHLCIHVKTSFKLKHKSQSESFEYFFVIGLFLFTLVVFFGPINSPKLKQLLPKTVSYLSVPDAAGMSQKHIYGIMTKKNIHFMVDLPIVNFHVDSLIVPQKKVPAEVPAQLLLFRDPPLGHEGQTKSPNHPPPARNKHCRNWMLQQNSPNRSKQFFFYLSRSDIYHIYIIYNIYTHDIFAFKIS